MQKLFVTTLFGMCVLAALIFFLNEIALEHFLYWRFWWYDIMMHFLGGAVISSIVVWSMTRFGFTRNLSRYASCMWTVLFVLVIGAGWEVFEYVNGFFIGEVNVVADTALDLVMDVVGGLAGWYVLVQIFTTHEESTTSPSLV